jgi:integrase
MRRERQDKTYPLVFRIGHQRRTATIQLDLYLMPNDWNSERRIVRNSYSTDGETVKRLNNRLAKRKARAIELIEKLEEAGRLAAMSVTDIKTFVEKYLDSDSADPITAAQPIDELKPQDFFEFADRIIKDLTEAKRIGTKKSYQCTIDVLEKFHGSRKLTFAQIDYEFLMKFETKHYAKGLGANGLSVYMRNIRSLYNRAIKAKVADEKLYPFKAYKIKSEPTRKRAIGEDALNSIIALELDSTHTLFHARNYFVASYMMYGMNFTDMAYMTEASLMDGRVQYRRSKTSKLYDIKITPALQEILDYYRSHRKGNSPYLFPIIKRTSAEGQDKDIQWARKRYNKKLKELAKVCGISANLTSYVSRHSFASQAVLLEIPVLAVSTMLGHSSLKTTQIYLAGLPTQMMDDYHAKILQGKPKPKPEEIARKEVQAATV